jgi:hypothetical protein
MPEVLYMSYCKDKCPLSATRSIKGIPALYIYDSLLAEPWQGRIDKQRRAMRLPSKPGIVSHRIGIIGVM